MGAGHAHRDPAHDDEVRAAGGRAGLAQDRRRVRAVARQEIVGEGLGHAAQGPGN